MANLIASGLTAVTSADFTLLDGASAMLNLSQGGTTISGEVSASIQLKASDGSYFEVSKLTAQTPALLVYGPATYRVVKAVSTMALAVDKT